MCELLNSGTFPGIVDIGQMQVNEAVKNQTLNKDFPLIPYNIGDYAEVKPLIFISLILAKKSCP